MKKTHKILGGILIVAVLILSTLVLAAVLESVNLNYGTNSLVEYDTMEDLSADRTLTLNWSNNFTGYDGTSDAEVVIAVYVPTDYGIASTSQVTISDDTQFDVYNVSEGNCTGLNVLAGEDIWSTNCTLIVINGTLEDPTGGFSLNIDINLSDDCITNNCTDNDYEVMFSDLIVYKKEVNANCNLSTYNNIETYNGTHKICYALNESGSGYDYSCILPGNPTGTSVPCNITKGIGSMYNSTYIMEQGTTGIVKNIGSGEEFIIELKQGWNLISIPLILDNSSVDAVLTNVDYSIIWQYDQMNEWEKYKVTFPASYDFETFEPDRGYWIKVNTPYNLTVTGTSGGNRNVNLAEGWNLIGYTSRESISVPDIMSSLDYSIIWQYDQMNEWEKYKVTFPASYDFSNMTAGRGYWIKVDAADNLTYTGT